MKICRGFEFTTIRGKVKVPQGSSGFSDRVTDVFLLRNLPTRYDPPGAEIRSKWSKTDR